MTSKLEAIDKRLAQLQVQRQKLQVQEAKRERARRAQQLAILGGWLMANDPAMVEMIKASLKRRQDRAAFGLPPLDAKADDLGL